MPSDTHTEASDATTPGPELRNGQLVVLMGSRAPMALGQPPDIQAELKVRVGSLKIRLSSFNQRVTGDCQAEKLEWGADNDSTTLGTPKLP
jgi:hypothetical protein